MKRIAVGAALLLLILAGGILSAGNQIRYHKKVAGLLEQAAQQAMAGELPGAKETALDARGVWERGWSLAAVFTDHNSLEQINEGFVRLDVYGEAGDLLAFGAICADLAGQVRALGDAHGVRWWNFL